MPMQIDPPQASSRLRSIGGYAANARATAAFAMAGIRAPMVGRMLVQELDL